jgi:prophage DNA circulation protein
VEDLGKRLRIFEITGIVKGALYLIEKQKLEDAMTLPGLGVLVHPFYGNVTVYPLEYELVEEDTSIGIAKFSLRFAEAEENFSPTITSNLAGVVADLYRQLYVAVDTAINLEYTMVFIRNIEDAVQVTQRIIDKLGALYRIASSSDEGRDTFRRTSDSFERKQYAINQDSELLGTNFTDLLGDFDSLSSDQVSRFNTNAQAFGLGSDDSFTTPITNELIERNKNRKLLNGTFNYLILINLFGTVTLLTFEDELQLNTTQDLLESFYRDLISNDAYLLTNALIDNLNKIRVAVRRYFDTIRLTIAKVATITTPPTPVAVLSHQYYGSTDNYQELLDLNNWTNPAIISGSIKVLEQ